MEDLKTFLILRQVQLEEFDYNCGRNAILTHLFLAFSHLTMAEFWSCENLFSFLFFLRGHQILTANSFHVKTVMSVYPRRHCGHLLTMEV